MRVFAVAVLLSAAPTIANAGCLFATNPCSTDDQGNTYTSRQNLGGGYNSYINGNLNSQTRQNLSGGYTEEFSSGARRYHNTNPFEPAQEDPYQPKRKKSLFD